MERAEYDIEEMHRTRFYGIDPRTGRERKGPLNRGYNPFGPVPRDHTILLWLLEFPLRHLQMVMRIAVPVFMFVATWFFGYSVSYIVGDHLEDNLGYIKK